MRRLVLLALTLVVSAGPVLAAEAASPDAVPEVASHLERARAFIATGDHTQALAEQTRAIAIAPAAASFKERARTWALKRQCDLAVADFSRAIEINPRDVESYLGRAECLRALGQFNRAADDLTLLLRFDSRASDVFKLRAHVRLAQGNASAALTDLRWALDIEPRDVQLMQMLGYARFANGDYEIAATNLQRALRFRDDMRTMLFLYLARARSGSDGVAELEKNMGYLRTRSWPFPVVALYLGHAKPENVFAEAKDETMQCMANFYVGHWLQVQGRRADGFALLKKAANTCPKSVLEYETLAVELRRLRFQF